MRPPPSRTGRRRICRSRIAESASASSSWTWQTQTLREVSRGLLDFRADTESPTHDKNFAKDKTVILYCASGGRAALGGKLLKDMGYEKVFNMGGFKDWVAGGGATEPA